MATLRIILYKVTVKITLYSSLITVTPTTAVQGLLLVGPRLLASDVSSCKRVPACRTRHLSSLGGVEGPEESPLSQRVLIRGTLLNMMKRDGYLLRRQESSEIDALLQTAATRATVVNLLERDGYFPREGVLHKIPYSQDSNTTSTTQ